MTIVDSGAFDPYRIPRDHPVRIAGTTGHYAQFTLFSLDADTGPGSDKYVAWWTIAFQAPSGEWVFAWVQDMVHETGLDDPTVIAAAYDKLDSDVLHDRAAGDCAGQCTAVERVGAYTVNVTADNLDDPATYFSIADALG